MSNIRLEFDRFSYKRANWMARIGWIGVTNCDEERIYQATNTGVIFTITAR